MASVVAGLWIPAFAGMTGEGDGNDRGVAGMSRAIRVCKVWTPAFAGMTGGGDGNDGRG